RAHHLDPSAALVDPIFPEMRVLRGDAAQIVPHPADRLVDARVVELGQGAAQVLAGASADAKARTDRAREPPSEYRGPRHRQEPGEAEEQPSRGALERVEAAPSERARPRHGGPWR